MDIDQYNRIYSYLTQQIIPTELITLKSIKQFKNFCIPYTVQNNYLYRNDKRNPGKLLRVIRTHEMKAILYMMHNDPTAGHFATDIMFDKIRKRYYWPQMYENIRAYVKSCDKCQRRGKPSKHEDLHPIIIQAPFYQIGIDFVGPLPITDKRNKHIIVAIDYFTKWPEAKAVPEATASQVVQFIYEEIICRHGCPMKILTDRGTHFNNQMVNELMSKFEIKHLLSTPYHPQTNGLVERFNKTLCESLAKTAQEISNWDLQIAPTLFAYRTSKQSTTKISPFYLTYGRDERLPLDRPIETNVTLNQHIESLVDDLSQIREKLKTIWKNHKQIRKIDMIVV
jgi:transposase InsO family protein